PPPSTVSNMANVAVLVVLGAWPSLQLWWLL
nr:unnamed protein product [Mus musculus]